MDKDYYEKFILFNEQHALLLIFYPNNICLKTIPSQMIALDETKKKPCIFHYEKNKFAYRILPQELHTDLIKKQKIESEIKLEKIVELQKKDTEEKIKLMTSKIKLINLLKKLIN